MNGMMMMLKSMGIDPTEMLQTAKDMGDAVAEVQASLARIEEKQDRILALLEPTPDNFVPAKELSA